MNIQPGHYYRTRDDQIVLIGECTYKARGELVGSNKDSIKRVGYWFLDGKHPIWSCPDLDLVEHIGKKATKDTHVSRAKYIDCLGFPSQSLAIETPIEVGKTYNTRSGKKARVVGKDESFPDYQYLASTDHRDFYVNEYGQARSFGSEYDLLGQDFTVPQQPGINIPMADQTRHPDKPVVGHRYLTRSGEKVYIQNQTFDGILEGVDSKGKERFFWLDGRRYKDRTSEDDLFLDLTLQEEHEDLIKKFGDKLDLGPRVYKVDTIRFLYQGKEVSPQELLNTVELEKTYTNSVEYVLHSY